jgi:hypothetical protein
LYSLKLFFAIIHAPDFLHQRYKIISIYANFLHIFSNKKRLSPKTYETASLIPNAENGLFSHFIFYFMDIKPVWKDVFANSGDQTRDLYFKDLGEYFHCFHNQLKQCQEMRFCLTTSQQQAFNAYFVQAQIQFLALYSDDYIATVRRLGLITFRIAMILTVLRLMQNQEFATLLICSDTDFNTALEFSCKRAQCQTCLSIAECSRK